MRIIRNIALIATLAAGALDAQAADLASLLSPSRIAALPAGEREAWARYVEASRRAGPGEPVADGLRRMHQMLDEGGGQDRRGVRRALDRLLQAQFPNGCWPDVYPLPDGGDAAGFRHAAAALNLLREVAAGAAAPWVGGDVRRRAARAAERGTECVARAQVVVDGRRTGWSARHDPLTLAPLGAPAVLLSAETASLLGVLMDADDPRAAAAVREGAGWLRETMVWGFAQGAEHRPFITPGGGPLWSAVYEMGSNRAVYTWNGAPRNDLRTLADSGWTARALTGAPALFLARYDSAAAARATSVSAPVPGRPDVMVDAGHGGADGQVVGGMPIYRTLGAALAAAPADGGRAFVIAVRNGRYREKLSIDKPNVHLVGESRDGTVLTYDVAAGHLSPGGWPYGTRGSWTLRVAAPGFRLERMTVENAFDFMANEKKPEGERVIGTQAVAVMLDSGSDRAVFRDCRLSGHQDTLFPNAGRAYFGRCEILGSVDFIFGAGRAVFEECDIVSRDRGSATNNGYVTAPSTPISQPYGFLFVGGRLRRETPGMAPNSVTLGRPWHPSGRPDAIGSAVFIHVWMDDHVGATGWSPMNSTDAAGHRVENRPEDARFYEFGSTGPGAVASPSRRVLTPEQAAEHTILRVLDGWNPAGR